MILKELRTGKKYKEVVTMKKYLANIVTSSRILASVVLFLCSDFDNLYLGFYVYCGITDFIDGPIARKTGSASSLGAALDTIGDVLTYLSLVKILVMKGMIPPWILIWLGVMIVFGFVFAFFAKHKFNKFYLPHTYLGKTLGAFIFGLPIAVHFKFGEPWMIVICSVMTLVLLEIAYIQVKNDTAEDFVPTIFHCNKKS